jgi:hypothetical protein
VTGEHRSTIPLIARAISEWGMEGIAVWIVDMWAGRAKSDDIDNRSSVAPGSKRSARGTQGRERSMARTSMRRFGV